MSVPFLPFHIGPVPEVPPDRVDPAGWFVHRSSGLRVLNTPHAPPLRAVWPARSQLQRFDAAWTDLTTRSLEPNGFLDPAFAQAAALHLVPGARPHLLRIENTRTGELSGMFAWSRGPRRFGTLARGWLPPIVAQGSPLIVAAQGDIVLDSLLNWFADHEPQVQGLLFPAVPCEGPFASAVRNIADRRNLSLRSFSFHRRAILYPHSSLDGRVASRHEKEWRRQLRILSSLGKLKFKSVRNASEIKHATERFLFLEAAGWKGRAGTALLCDPSLATFTRAMTRQAARTGNCRIDALEIDDQPVAMAIVLQGGSRSWLWKIAYDETHARLSPGVHLIRTLTRQQTVNPVIAATDSCAVENHPMINRLWPDRIAIADLAVSVTEDRTGAFRRACDGEERRLYLRACAKHIYQTVCHAISGGI